MATSRTSRTAETFSAVHAKKKIPGDAKSVFRCLTDTKLVPIWLWADHARIGKSVGQPYEVFWLPEGDADSTAGATITALDRGRLIAFTWRGPTRFAPYGFMNLKGKSTHVVVTLLPDAKGGTEVHIVHSGFGEGKEWKAAKKFFEKAWADWLTSLRELVKNRATLGDAKAAKLKLKSIKIEDLRQLGGLAPRGPVIEGQF
jgi:uncharacterized protein YndB with AHSA1/START domain